LATSDLPNKNERVGGVEDKQGADSTGHVEPVVVIPPPPPPPSESEPSVVIPPADITPVAPPEPEPKEKTASRLAYVLIISFFTIAGAPLIAIFLVGNETMAIKTNTAIEWLKGVSAYLAGLIGAVIGYYFRAEIVKKSE
jgi:hypothetical protein